MTHHERGGAFFCGIFKVIDIVITSFAIAKEKPNNNNNIVLKTNVACENNKSDGVHLIN
jgi:hypothetical protein